MRILLTVHQFLPAHVSGTELLTLNAARELRRLGHDVTVLTGHPAKVPLQDHERFDEYVYDGIRVKRFLHQYVPMGGQNNIVELEYRNELLGRELRRYFADRRPDIVHAWHLSRLSTTVIDACRESGIPIVFTATDFWAVCPMNQLRLPDGSLCEGPDGVSGNCVRHVAEISQSGPIASRLRVLPDAVVAAGVVAVKNELLPEQWFFPLVRATANRAAYVRQRINQVDRVLTPTRLMERMLARNGVRPSLMQYCPYGVRLEGMERRTDKGGETCLRIGYIGAIVEHKGVHVLVDAVRAIPRSVPVELKIHGKLTEFPEYVERLRRLIGGDERIQLVGPFPHDQASRVHAEMDVLVVPSLWYENTPLVIYSAMAAGCPVVATNLGGMAEAVKDGVDGLLFEMGDARELSRVLTGLAQNRGLVRSMSRATTIPRDVPAFVADIEQVYADVLAERRR